jgi:signal transduction histidine kinase
VSRGLGLGLYICREIVRAHGGSLHVESAAGEGTTFTVTMPRGVSPAQGAVADDESAEGVVRTGRAGAA